MISEPFGPRQWSGEGSWARGAVEESARSQSMREGRRRRNRAWSPCCGRLRRGVQQRFDIKENIGNGVIQWYGCIHSVAKGGSNDAGVSLFSSTMVLRSSQGRVRGMNVVIRLYDWQKASCYLLL